MSFGMWVQSHRDVSKALCATESQAIKSLKGASWVEVSPGERKGKLVASLAIQSKTAPGDVKAFFSELVAWVRTRGYALVDAQSGEPIDLAHPRDISLEFRPHQYAGTPCLMGRGRDWEIVVGQLGVVGHLRQSSDGDVRLVFGDVEESAVPIAWLLEKIRELRND